MGNVNMEAHQIHYKGEETAKDMFEKLDLIAQQVGDLPTFTSDDRVFLEKLPALPTAEGKTVLTAETDDQGETNLSYASPEVEGEDVAPEFSDAEAYSDGDLVFHDGILYKFTSDHAAGDWDATEATQTSVAGELSELKNTLTDSVTNGDMRPVTSNAVYDYLNDRVNVTKQSSDTSWSNIVTRLFALIDLSRINGNSILVMDGYIYRIAYYDPTLASVGFERAHTRYTSNPGLNVDYISINSSGGYHYSASLNFSTNTWTNYGLDSSVPNSMTIFYR